MAKRSIGLDFGGTAFRAVLVEEGKPGAGYRLVDYQEYIPPALPPENRPDPTISYREIIKNLISREGWRSAPITIGLPGGVVSRRTLSFPFRERNKLDPVVPFELEGLIADSIEDVIVDYQFVDQNDQGSRVMAAAVAKPKIAERLQSLNAIGVDPRILDDEVMALSSLLFLLDPIVQEGPAAILEIGAQKTGLVVYNHGRAETARTIRIGGDHLTQSLAAFRGISWEEAETLKISGTDKIPAEIWDRAFLPLVQEIGLTLDAFRRTQGETPNGIYLCGRGTIAQELSGYLQSRLDLPCERISLQGELLQIPRAFSSDFDCTAAQALALALRGLSQSQSVSPVNFRKGEFTFRSRMEESRGKLIYFGVVASLVIILGLVNFLMGYSNLRAEDRKLTDQMRKVFITAFPETKQLPEGYELREMRTRIQAVQGSGEFSASSEAVVDLLKIISERIPQDVNLEIRELIYDPEKIRLRGRASSFDTVDRIKTDLAGSPAWSSLEVTDAKVSIDQKGVDFTMVINLVKKL
ncbi:MAG: pilus assembly protein PilM [Proteobacteria bacterium]|nr:pilus assembly protein PilM [Pseudomonadota bacterium]